MRRADAATAVPGRVRWLLDQPVSSSGRLAARLRARAGARSALDGRGRDEPGPGAGRNREVVVTADAAVLDRAGAWLNFAALALQVASSFNGFRG